MGEPLEALSAEQLDRFIAGLEAYQMNFSAAQGLGPGFNQTSCASCHNNPVGGPGAQMVTRFGRMDKKGGFDPLASLGGSLLQANSLDEVCQEFIPASANVTSMRVTPGVVAYGLVEAIADASILSIRDAQPMAQRGIARMGTPIEGGPERVGRFGWKAQLATVLSFSADASLQEMGITSALLPIENAPQGDWDNVLECDFVADPEEPFNAAGVSFTQSVTDFQRYLAAPPQMPFTGMAGETVFVNAGCAVCHTPSFTTRDEPDLEDALRNIVIRPFSDWLLHDMGAAADGIADGTADVRDMRTPPLWGIRRRNPMWHDGRVGGGTFETRVVEAIALHGAVGSQGQAAAAAYTNLASGDRDALIEFLNSLGRAPFDADGNNVVDLADLYADGLGIIGCSSTDDVIGPNDPCAVNDVDVDGSVTQADMVLYIQVIGDLAIDCDADGVVDVMQIFLNPSLDANQDGLLDPCTPCPGDASGNGQVDADDILVVLSDWGPCTGCDGDVTGDAIAGVDDILVIIAAWGDCP
jgi:mono/diheme cytochrome c family protein